MYTMGIKTPPPTPPLSLFEEGSHLMGCDISRDWLTGDIVPSKDEAPSARHCQHLSRVTGISDAG